MNRLAIMLAGALLWPAAAVRAQADVQTPGVPAETAFSLPALPYALDAQIMRIHHGKHHQGYVDNLNKAVAAHPALAGQSLEQLLARAGTLPAAVRNNAGGHWNHSFFWTGMAPPHQSGEPSAELRSAIETSFGSLNAFKAAFADAGLTRFGSGWVWLVVDEDGKLAVTSTPNQDNPLMDVAEVRGTPLLGNDVWEHAYYLKYQNRRGDYLARWWEVVNWAEVSRRYAKAAAQVKQ